MSVLPGIVTRNWKLKLAALALALLLWTSLRLEALDRQVLPSVPVRIQLNDPQWAVGGEPDPASVEVHFSGPARELFSLYLERPTVTVPVDQVASGDTAVLLRPEWVRLPNRPGVVVEEIRPRQVALRFDPITQGVAPVALRIDGSLPSDLALAEPLQTDPEVVRVSGPARQVEAVDSVRLRPLDLAQVTATGSRRLPVDTTGLYGLVISPSAVRVDYTVDERVERSLSDVPVVPAEGWEEVRLEPASTDVVLSGAESVVEGVDAGALWTEVPAEALSGLVAGNAREVPLVVRGLPPLVEARPTLNSVVARIPDAEAGTDGGADPPPPDADDGGSGPDPAGDDADGAAAAGDGDR